MSIKRFQNYQSGGYIDLPVCVSPLDSFLTMLYVGIEQFDPKWLAFPEIGVAELRGVYRLRRCGYINRWMKAEKEKEE